MVDFVTADQARAQIRIDEGMDEQWLADWIPGVSAQVRAWLKQPWRLYELQRDAAGKLVPDIHGNPSPVLDEDGKPVIARAVVLATLVELSSQYRYREGEGDNTVPPDAGHGYVLCRAATALLAPLRCSTVS